MQLHLDHPEKQILNNNQVYDSAKQAENPKQPLICLESLTKTSHLLWEGIHQTESNLSNDDRLTTVVLHPRVVGRGRGRRVGP